MKLSNILAATVIALLLPACSSVKVWPFDDDKSTGRTSDRVNATEYNCEGGKRFYVRSIDNGAAVWLILRDREVRLDKAASGNSYSNGITLLDINGSDAALKDGDKTTFSGCKAATKAN
jgi:membrane-bound inhibitor of C-type lysozyme